MSPDQIVRAWKDAEYGASLAAEPSVQLPPHPVGPIDLADVTLELSGGYDSRTEYVETLGCCQGFTQLGKCDLSAVAVAGYCSFACFTIWWTYVSICAAE